MNLFRIANIDRNHYGIDKHRLAFKRVNPGGKRLANILAMLGINTFRDGNQDVAVVNFPDLQDIQQRISAA